MERVKQIVVEFEETVVMHSGEFRVVDLCPVCEATTEMATPWIAATLHGSTEREMFRLIEVGEIHSIEKERILVCVGCVRRAIAKSAEYAEPILIKPIGILKKP